MIHGTRGSYEQGCRCAECTEAKRLYYHRRMRESLLEEIGEKETTFVPAEDVRKRIRQLLAKGYTKRGICYEFGIPKSTMHNLMSKHHRTGEPVKRVLRSTAEKVFAIPLNKHGVKTMCPMCGYRDAMQRSGLCYECEYESGLVSYDAYRRKKLRDRKEDAV